MVAHKPLREGFRISHSRSVAIQVIKIAIQCVTVELDGDYLFGGGISNSKRFLQTLEHTLAILVRELTTAGVKINPC